MSEGPIWRSANHIEAIGAPALIISSPTINRSIGGRPPPPNSVGQVMPIHPCAANSLANSFEYPLIHESLCLPKRATASVATLRARSRNSTCSGVHVKSIDPDANSCVRGGAGYPVQVRYK